MEIIFKFKSLILFIAVLGDFILPYTLAVFYPKYSHTKQVMSVLGNQKSPVKLPYNIWLTILGVMFLVTAVNFYFRYENVSGTLSVIGMALLSLYGIGACILSGLFSVDETKSLDTISEKIHGIGAGIGFIALLFISLIMAFLHLKSGEKGLVYVYILFFVMNTALFAVFIMSERESFAGTIIGKTGLWQRILLVSMYIPLLLMEFLSFN